MFKDILRVSFRDINVVGYFVDINIWRMIY